MQPDLNRLRVFYHIYFSLSITVAAKKLHITPSAVSQQLKKLEMEIKTPLFTRLHKRLVPTPAGSRLFDLVQPLLMDLEAGIDIMEQERSEPSGLLRIGAPVEFGSIYLPYVMATFRETYKKVNFALELGRPSTLLTKVDTGDLDFAFVDTFPTKEQHYRDFGRFSIQPVIEEEVVLACSITYFEDHLKGETSFEILASGSFISQEHDARAISNWFLHHFGKAPGRYDIALTVENHQAVVSGIRHNLGLGIIVTHLAWSEIQAGKIKVMRNQEEQTVNRISVAQLQEKIPTLAEKTFLTHFKNLASKSRTLKRLNLCIH
jgi:DNA-binding transcriptional LysR family regulator